MRGAGSDFVLLDGRAALPADIGPLPAKLAGRRFGVDWRPRGPPTLQPRWAGPGPPSH